MMCLKLTAWSEAHVIVAIEYTNTFHFSSPPGSIVCVRESLRASCLGRVPSIIGALSQLLVSEPPPWICDSDSPPEIGDLLSLLLGTLLAATIALVLTYEL